MFFKNCFSINSLFILISLIITFNIRCIESDNYNKTSIHNILSNSLIHSYLKTVILSKLFDVNYNNKSFNQTNHQNNQTFSEFLLNKSSNDSESNSTILLRQLFSQLDKNDQNISSSESRTLSSWLGLKRFRRPQIKLKPVQMMSSSQDQPQAVSSMMAPQIPYPQFLSRPTFPGPHDPESMLLPPSLFEESGIKYWLKFIENAGKDDIPPPEEFSPRPSNQENGRMRRPSSYSQSSQSNSNQNSRPIKIEEKPYEDNDEYYDDEELHDDHHHDHHDDHIHDEDEKEDEPKSSPSGGSSSNSKQTFDTSPRCDKFTSDICVDDFEYPEQAIVDEIYKRREIFELMYSEVRDNVPLVDGIPRDVEESYNYDYYYDNKDPQTSSSGFGGSDKNSPVKGFVCPSEVMYGKPKLARNKKGDWKVIVNAGEFTQTVRMEKCLKPNFRCNYISKPEFDSRCAQVHSFHRLLVFEKGKGFYIDTFRIPTACTCHVTRRVTYKPTATNTQPVNFNKKKKPSPQLSNTLWSILGGPMPNEGSGSMSQSQELIQNQLNLLQQLKHFPQLSHITPDNVFQQLMDLQSNNDGYQMPQKSYQTNKKTNPISFGQSGLNYLLPSLMMNDEQQPNTERKSHSQMNSQPLAQIHQSSGTTTLLNPNVNGAPVVQVIHVPVTSSMGQNPDPQPVYKGKNPAFNDYQYLDASSLFYKPKPNTDEFLQTFGDDLSQLSVNSFKPLMLGMSSKTNSSLMSPKEKDKDKDKEQIKRDSDSVDNSKNNSNLEETNKKRKVMVENTLNKKINFSYHPILEYISN